MSNHEYVDHPKCKHIQICRLCGCVKELITVGEPYTVYQLNNQITQTEPLCKENSHTISLGYPLAMA